MSSLKNFSLLVFLINDSVRCVAATYEAEDHAKRELFKTFDQDLKPGDFVIVPTDTRHKMTVCKIVEVDLEPDLESGVDMKWIISKVDRTPYEQIIAREASSIKKARDVEKTAQRRELRQKIFLHDSEMQNLALSDLSQSEPVSPAPSAPITPVGGDPQF